MEPYRWEGTSRVGRLEQDDREVASGVSDVKGRRRPVMVVEAKSAAGYGVVPVGGGSPEA
jgi:hypothetical protein